MGSLRRKRRNDFSANKVPVGWYDAELDQDLIEASFAKQYGIRLSKEEISVSEYYRLLGGLMHDTPLGAIIEIRSENSEDMLKHFTPEQKRIRSEWRRYISKKQYETMTAEEKKSQMNQLQAVFKSMAGFK